MTKNGLYICSNRRAEISPLKPNILNPMKAFMPLSLPGFAIVIPGFSVKPGFAIVIPGFSLLNQVLR